jgi:itaconate CoA-transferase
VTAEPAAASGAPLAGVTVVALEQAVAAPFATRQLADLGARVIKVERPEVGDFARGYDETVNGISSYFAWLNRGKESIELDLKDDLDLALLRRMIGRSDIVVQNLAPGATQRLGLSPDELRRTNDALITCSISGYGDEGPSRDKKAYDLLVQCEAGLLSVTGDPSHPAKCGISIADIAAGMYAYTGVLTALLRRTRHGQGTHVDVSMLEALGEWMMQPYLFANGAGHAPPRSGMRHASIAPYGPYRAGRGGTIFLGIQNDREWERLCSEVLHAPELSEDPRFMTNSQRVANDGALTELIEQALTTWTVDQIEELLDRLGIANARLRSVTELGAHPQLQARHSWHDVASPAGPVRSLRPPARLSGTTPSMGPIPPLGAHNRTLREEFAEPAAERA